MTSIIRKLIPVTVGLMLLAGSAAAAAAHEAHHETLRDELVVPNVKRQLPLSSSRSDDSSPYIGLWVEGYPRTATR